MDKEGLYGKYIIEKADGTAIDPNAKYFVIRYDVRHNKSIEENSRALIILYNYAESIRKLNNKLYQDLLLSLLEESLALTLMKIQHLKKIKKEKNVPETSS